MAKECPVPAGILVIVGGKEDKGNGETDGKEMPEGSEHFEVLKRFVELTRKKDPVIEVITSASTEGDESFEDYRKAFADLKAEKVGHIHHNTREDVLNEEFMDRMENADGIFFAGGDQLKYTSRYGGTN